MKHSGSILVPFEKTEVAVQWEGGSAFNLTKFLFRASEKFEHGRTDVTFTLVSKNGDTFLCYRNEILMFEGKIGETAVALLDAVIYELAKKCADGLLFHAAALYRKGCGILLPGRSKSGKTFLSACLARRGYAYLTDEMTVIAPQTLGMKGFRKPLHIKDAAIPGLNSVLKKPDRMTRQPGDGIIPVDQGILVDSSCFGPVVKSGNPTAGLIIFPEYKPRSKFEMIRLTTAKTGLLLMKTFINARNLPSHGFNQIGLLARKVPAYAVTYENSFRASNEIDALIGNKSGYPPCTHG